MLKTHIQSDTFVWTSVSTTLYILYTGNYLSHVTYASFQCLLSIIHLKNEESVAQGGYNTCPRSHSW